MDDPKKLLTVEEVAEQMAAPVVAVKSWLQQGKLRGVKVRKRWRVDPRDLHEFIYGVEPAELNDGNAQPDGP